jgi:hypothetical protein
MSAEEDDEIARIARGVRVVRVGHGANCSSIGSVIDTLFASAVVGSAILTAVAAAMAREPRTVVPARPPTAGGTESAPPKDDADGGGAP